MPAAVRASDALLAPLNMTTDDLPRCSTGVSGLDAILNGGFRSGYSYVIKGSPGVGKTTVALQFLMDGVARGEQALYVTLSESDAELGDVARSHGWDIRQIAVVDLSLLRREIREKQSMFKPLDAERGNIVGGVLKQFNERKPARVVIDSVAELRLLCGDPLAYRHQILELKEAFANSATTLFLEDNRPAGDEEDLEAITHGAIELEKTTSDFGSEKRRLKVRKMRGSDFHAGYHNYSIHKGGLAVYPRLHSGKEARGSQGGAISSGLPEFDRLLGGGLDRGTSSLFSGPTGTGKSTFSLKFACEAAKAGEKVAIFSFEESTRTTMQRAESMGFGLKQWVDAGTVTIRQIDPGELSPGEFVHAIREAVITRGVGMVIVDSLNGYLNAMPDERFLSIQLHELLMFLSQHGVVTILTVAQHGVIDVTGGPIDASYLADTLVVMRYFEAFGKVKKAISVVKKRSSAHEEAIREYRFDKEGIRMGEPLEAFQGVLTGTPQFVGRREDVLPLQRPATGDGRG